MAFLWTKTFFIFVVTWFAGLFYLPRLYVYHAMADDTVSIERFEIMERKLNYGIMTPSAVLAVAMGVWLWLAYDFSGIWLHIELAPVLLLIAYPAYCIELLLDFKQDRNRHGHVY